MPWRTGRKVGRTIYDDDDTLIGVMDTPELAQRVVEAVNGGPDEDDDGRCPAWTYHERVLLQCDRDPGHVGKHWTASKEDAVIRWTGDTNDE